MFQQQNARSGKRRIEDNSNEPPAKRAYRPILSPYATKPCYLMLGSGRFIFVNKNGLAVLPTVAETLLAVDLAQLRLFPLKADMVDQYLVHAAFDTIRIMPEETALILRHADILVAVVVTIDETSSHLIPMASHTSKGANTTEAFKQVQGGATIMATLKESFTTAVGAHRLIASSHTLAASSAYNTKRADVVPSQFVTPVNATTPGSQGMRANQTVDAGFKAPEVARIQLAQAVYAPGLNQHTASRVVNPQDVHPSVSQGTLMDSVVSRAMEVKKTTTRRWYAVGGIAIVACLVLAFYAWYMLTATGPGLVTVNAARNETTDVTTNPNQFCYPGFYGCSNANNSSIKWRIMHFMLSVLVSVPGIIGLIMMSAFYSTRILCLKDSLYAGVVSGLFVWSQMLYTQIPK